MKSNGDLVFNKTDKESTIVVQIEHTTPGMHLNNLMTVLLTENKIMTLLLTRNQIMTITYKNYIMTLLLTEN